MSAKSCKIGGKLFQKFLTAVCCETGLVLWNEGRVRSKFHIDFGADDTTLAAIFGVSLLLFS